MNGSPTARDQASGLQSIFLPRSIAVIGAGRDPTSMSGHLFRNLLGSFRGPIYPVNPKASEIAGVRAYPTILAVPGAVDLAFLAVPVKSVLATAKECVTKGVRGLVVITAGFSEAGDLGKQLECELLDVVQAAGIRMVGPNCLGVFNTDPSVRLHGTFAASAMPPGNVGICSQSGALGVVIPEYLRHWNLGASTFASIGNKADVSENDLLDYWRDDPATDVILLYLESFSDPREFRDLAAVISRRKPIVALKAARTGAGARAASSHTAALTSPDRAAAALFQQAGVLRVETLQELFDVTALLASQPLPKGRRVAILTNAGGPGILCADTLAAHGLLVPEFSRELQAELRRSLRPEASVQNPIDLIASIDAGEFRRCLESLMRSEEVDAVITMYVPREPGTSPAVARAIREVTSSSEAGKTSLAVVMQAKCNPEELRDGTTRVPSYLYPEAAARALAYAVEYAERRNRPVGRIPEFRDILVAECRRIVDRALLRFGPAGGWLETEDVQQLLTACRLRVPCWRVVRSADEAVAVADDWKTPVVIKVIGPTILHKTEVGGVAVNVSDEADIRSAYAKVTAAAAGASAALIQEYIPGGQETFIGVSCDRQFGHLLAFGCGGTSVELLNDVVCRLHPLTGVDADEMIRGVRTAALLTGYRGQPATDIEALQETLLRVSTMVTHVPEIAELDLNPIKVLSAGKGVFGLDGRIRLAHLKDQSP